MRSYTCNWDTCRQAYYYCEINKFIDDNTFIDENYDSESNACDKPTKKTEPIKKFNRWFDKFNLIQSTYLDDKIIDFIKDNYVDYDNITPQEIKSLLKSFNKNKYYKVIPSIYCHFKNDKFHIPEYVRVKIKELYYKIVSESESFYSLNYNFFLSCVLKEMNYNLLAYSIPKIKSTDKRNEYMLIWNNFQNIISQSLPISDSA